MRKVFCSLALINAIIVVAVMAIGSYLSANLETLSDIPYGMDNACYGFFAYTPDEHNPHQQKIIQEITKMLNTTSGKLIFQDDNSFGIGVHGIFNQSYDLSMVLGEVPKAGQREMIKKASAYGVADEQLQQTFLTANGEMQLVGLYDERNPLDTQGYDYIFDFAFSSQLDGVYTFEINEEALFLEIVSLFSTNGYELQNIIKPADRTVQNILASMTHDRFFPSMMIGIVFCYLNYLLIMRVLFSSFQRVAVIHIQLGATNRSFILQVSKKLIPVLLFGATAGLLAYLILFRQLLSNSVLSYGGLHQNQSE